MEYTCAECGKPAVVVDDGNVIVRPCDHDTAGVIAHCSAVCVGESSVNSN